MNQNDLTEFVIPGLTGTLLCTTEFRLATE